MFPYTVAANSWLYSVWVFHIWELLRVQKQNIHVCQKKWQEHLATESGEIIKYEPGKHNKVLQLQ